MKALVLEQQMKLSLREFAIEETLGDADVEIAIKRVGVCGSDIHYYTNGKIGPFVVKEPMILGHEGAGVITRLGANVKHLKVGDRVCMEPGIPMSFSKNMKEGHYNLDPDVRFWATPPIHGITRESVIHPAGFTYKLPDNVSLAEGAMVEPLAIGFQAIHKAQIFSGDTAVVTGAGTIGLMIVLAALTQGCRKIFVVDISAEKLAIAKAIDPRVIPILASNGNDSIIKEVLLQTNGQGAEVVFEASGSAAVNEYLIDLLAPAGKLVYVGMPSRPVSLDVVKAQAKEVSMYTVFRYANMYERAIASLAAGLIDVKPLITHTFAFDDSIEAYEFAASPSGPVVKIQISLE